MKDDFGNRMKNYERAETGRTFIPMLPIYARIDGRSFSAFTRGLQRPFDLRITRAMIETTKFLVEETQALIGYTQSDEISLLWQQEHYEAEIFFRGKVQKLVSVLAGLATAKFNHVCVATDGLRERTIEMMPVFDCRVFQLPNRTEATNALLWREKDALKNAISMAARTFYSHEELLGKSGSEMQELIFQKGQNFNDYPTFFKRGTFIRRIFSERTISRDGMQHIPEAYRPTQDVVVTRSHIAELDMPIFTKVLNREEVVFCGAAPVT